MIGIIYIQIRAQFKFKVILIIILSVPHQPFIIFMTEFFILHKNQLRQLQMGFITKEGLAQLDRYKYKSGKYSWLDNKLNPFWEWCVKLLPIDMAPNLVTFIGWLFVTMSYVIMLFYDYTFTKEIPNWIFLYASFCVFIYQTLDAIDGKQARRTGSSSPLGQLFDHGCDSFSITFFILGVCQAARLSADEVLIAFIALQTAFYFSNLLEYHTGILMTNVGQAFGVTQTQLICVLIHILTGIFGQKIWDIEIYSGTQLKSVIIYLVASIIILSSLFTYLQFVVSSNQKLINLSQIVPLISMFALAFVWVKSSIFSEFCGLIFINFGIYSSLIICKIIISSVTKMKLTTVHYEAGIFVICTILIGLFEYKNNKIAMITVLWVCLIINVINIGKFLSSTIIQITDHLGIYCFSLKRKQKKL